MESHVKQFEDEVEQVLQVLSQSTQVCVFVGVYVLVGQELTQVPE